jgi:predicted  nucleic acid-binding Zn-ribbon protein
VDDLLFALLDQRADFPGVSLLARHAPRPSPPRELIDPAPRYASEMRYSPPNYERYYRVDAPRAYRTDHPVAATDAIQNSRIEALEQLVRGLSANLASERQAVAGLLKELSRAANAQRDDQGRLQSDLFDRLQSIEQVVSGARANADGSTLPLEIQNGTASMTLLEIAQRLEQIENAVRTSGGVDGIWLAERIEEAIDLKPIAKRLDIIEEAVLSREPAGADASDRLLGLEAAVSRTSTIVDAYASRVEAAMTELGGRGAGSDAAAVSSVANGIESQTRAFNELARELGLRLTSVEAAVTGEIETAEAKHKAYVGDLAELHDALLKLNQNQHTLAGSIDQWRSDAAGDVASISSRLANLDRDNERLIETLNILTAHMDAMNRMFIERYHRRNRFWYWLFGTDDWLGASWPSQTSAIEADAAKSNSPEVA